LEHIKKVSFGFKRIIFIIHRGRWSENEPHPQDTLVQQMSWRQAFRPKDNLVLRSSPGALMYRQLSHGYPAWLHEGHSCCSNICTTNDFCATSPCSSPSCLRPRHSTCLSRSQWERPSGPLATDGLSGTSSNRRIARTLMTRYYVEPPN
jgi:hypothetical protein